MVRGKTATEVGNQPWVWGSVCCGIGLGESMGAALQLFRPDPSAELAESSGEDTLTFAEAIERYVVAKELAPRTADEHRTTLRDVTTWWLLRGDAGTNAHRSAGPMRVGEIADRRRLADFLDWVYERAKGSNSKNPGRVANKRRETLRAVLAWLEDVEELQSKPRLPPKRPQEDVAGQFFMTDVELSNLYWATYRLPRPHRWQLPYSVGAYWRAALTMFVTYGVDTQLIFAHDKRAEPIRWRGVYPPGNSPDRINRGGESEYGWLAWSRQKTAYHFVAPMNAVVAAHLKTIEPLTKDSESPIFGGSGSSRPCRRFQELVGLAKIPEKLDLDTGKPVPWLIKDLRKTSGTRHDDQTGSASVVLGHAMGEGSAAITQKHYSNVAPRLYRAITSLTYPEAFLSVIDESIRPPGLLFAK